MGHAVHCINLTCYGKVHAKRNSWFCVLSDVDQYALRILRSFEYNSKGFNWVMSNMYSVSNWLSHSLLIAIE